MLEERFSLGLSETGLLAGARHVLVACSGGADSTALLYLLAGWSPSILVVAHVEHGLRGEAGARDARAVAEHAASLHLPLRSLVVDVRSGRAHGESLEAAARRLRYAALLVEARTLPSPTLVATGHTLDDQAETVLLNLHRHSRRTRGGIRARRADGVVRPVLELRRLELRDFLQRRGVRFCEDETNEDERLLRNRIRRTVLPALEHRYPGISVRLARAGAAYAARLDRLDRDVDLALSAGGLDPTGPFPRELFRGGLSPEAAGRLLLRALAREGRTPGRAQLRNVLRRLAGPEAGVRDTLAGHQLRANSRLVRLEPPPPPDRLEL